MKRILSLSILSGLLYVSPAFAKFSIPVCCPPPPCPPPGTPEVPAAFIPVLSAALVGGAIFWRRSKKGKTNQSNPNESGDQP